MANKNPYFTSKAVNDKQKNERLIQLFSAIREGTSKAMGASAAVTYAQSHEFLKQVDPEMYDDVQRFFEHVKKVPPLVEKYLELAETSEVKVEAVDLIKAEIDQIRQRLNRSYSRHFKRLQEDLRKLKKALTYLEREHTRKLWEEEAIRQDFFFAERPEDHKPNPTNQPFREFVLPNKRLMRIRLLHNLPPEKILGVDLVYEQIDLKNERMRFVHLQYKMWDEKNFSINSSREARQLERMENSFCKGGYCDAHRPKGEHDYRMPFCSVFYRPTNKRQSKDASLITTGIHLPVCATLNTSGIRHLTRDEVYERGLSNSVFDELFRNGLAGSGWVSLADAEKFYQESKILDEQDSMVLNIRDEIGHDENKLENIKRLRDELNIR